jgi:hypothetical protein
MALLRRIKQRMQHMPLCRGKWGVRTAWHWRRSGVRTAWRWWRGLCKRRLRLRRRTLLFHCTKARPHQHPAAQQLHMLCRHTGPMKHLNNISDGHRRRHAKLLCLQQRVARHERLCAVRRQWRGHAENTSSPHL